MNLDRIQRQTGAETFQVIRDLSRRVDELERRLGRLIRNDVVQVTSPPVSSTSDLDFYVGTSAPLISPFTMQFWLDTSALPWQLKTNLKHQNGTPEWVTIGTGRET